MTRFDGRRPANLHPCSQLARTRRPEPAWLAGALLCLVVTVGPATAGVVGMRVSVTDVNQSTGEVSFDVSAFADSGSEVNLGAGIDDSSAVTYNTGYDFGYGFAPTTYQVRVGFQSDWNTIPHAAIDFGDGAQIDSTSLAYQGNTLVDGSPFRVFRGSFTHTYAPGNYLLRATAGPDGELNEPGLGLAATQGVPAGNVVSGNLNVQFTAFRTVYRLANPASPVNTQVITSFQSYPGTIRYITARQGLTIEGPGGPVGGPLEIPTLSSGVLLLLALALGASGLLLLRR